MSSTMSFALNFSGAGVFEQQRAAQERLARLDAHDYAPRARLLAILAAASVFSDPHAAAEAAAGATQAAQLAGDENSRAWGLIAVCVTDLSCETTPQRLAMTGEVLRIAQETGEIEFVSIAYLLHLAALVELGQIHDLDRALSPVGELLSSIPSLSDGRHVAWFRCVQSTLSGDPKNAELLAQSAYLHSQEAGDPDSQTVFVGQLAIIRWMQGRVVELEPLFLQARQAAPHEPVWAVSLAWMWLRQGRKSAARALVSALPPIAELPVDRNWLSTACILADAASELGDLSVVEQIYEALLPFEDRLVTIGLGITCWGTVARPLALAAAAMGKTDAAVAHYRRGIDVAGRAGAHPWLAELQWELAELLAKRAWAGDFDEAIALASEATATGRALQLHGIEGTASSVLASLRAPALQSISLAAVPEPTEPSRPRITVFGAFSVTSADGTVAHWQSRKARQLLKILIARRGAAVSRESLMDMLWPGASPEKLANRFSVAATTVRRALDPTGAQPRETYLEIRDGLVRLRAEALDIDAEHFLAEADLALVSTNSRGEQRARLTEAIALYAGEPLPEEQEELWAAEFRRQAHLAFFSLAHALAELYADEGDHLSRLEIYRRILSFDEFDQRAHEGVIDALSALGSHGQADSARNEYATLMRALGVPYSANSQQAAS